ncbi:DUF4349 domain-containing protein [Streptomyces sp. NBC_00094]|uniref:DUF4349 domain-containing protein n=1 Tax=Streptomyces sp. NBC_00094 TaxID=2903620 RepID=UPI0022563BB0|nr:DUF4349 domain-containing protein [Streptomyces sp. NBC_00094]MCX5393829.1 DUF4349 domain-containing protein [Streptomyces sp. NBC_00094]
MSRTRTVSRTRTAAAAALLTASLVLTGCGAGGMTDAGGTRDMSAEKPADAGAQAAKGAADSSSGSEATSATPGKATQPQHVIRTASLTVEVADAAKALATARGVATGAGGRVENETTERLDDTYVTSRVVLRVPQEQYDTVLTELAGTGKLLARKADAKDVTEQVVDVESRIATQRASVARVRTLMQRAEKLADVVILEGELSRRQADLESLLAQQSSLKDRTSMATITLELTEKEKPHVEKDEEEGRPGFGDALSGGWNALVGALAWIGLVLTALAPWLALALIAFLVWRHVIRPRRTARRATAAPETRPLPEANAAGVAAPAERPDTPGTGE